MKFLINLLSPKETLVDFIKERPYTFSPESNKAKIEYHAFVKYVENKEFLKDAYEKLKESAIANLGIPVYDLKRSDMHSKDSNGTFHYYKGLTLSQMKEESKKDIIKFKNSSIFVEHELVVPRIEILSERDYAGKILTLAHEIGHALCHIKNEENTEAAADAYVNEVITTYLGPFYTFILSIGIKCYCGNFPFKNTEDAYIEHFVFSPLRQKYSFDLI